MQHWNFSSTIHDTADSSELFDVSSKKLESSSSSPKNFFLFLATCFCFLLLLTTVLDAGQIITGFPPATWHAVLLHRSISWLWVAIGAFFQNLLHYKDLHKNTLIYTCRKARWGFLLIFFLDSASSFFFSFSFWITSTLARCPGLSLTHEHLSHKLTFF